MDYRDAFVVVVAFALVVGSLGTFVLWCAMVAAARYDRHMEQLHGDRKKQESKSDK